MSDIRKQFDAALVRLKTSMLEMFEHVTRAYKEMFTILSTNDITKANHLIESDQLINIEERKINEEAFLMILKQAPVAGDLRLIMTAVKIANDLERIADYAVNVATYIIKTTQDNTVYREEMMKYEAPLINMLVKIKEAYESLEPEAAFRVCDMDNVIDKLYQKDIKNFIRIASTTTDVEAEEASRALLVIKQFERTGDHITNIAEHIVFLHSGKQLELN